MNKYLTATSLAAGLTLSMGANAQIIDLFTDPAGGIGTKQEVVDTDTDGAANTSDGTGSFNEFGDFPLTILGGYRDLYVEVMSAPLNSSSTSVLKVEQGSLNFSNDAGIDGLGIVQWDGQDNSADLNFGLGGGLQGDGLDFVDQDGCPVGGCSEFNFTVISSDLGFQFTIGVWNDNLNWTEITFISGALAFGDTPETRAIQFSFFEDDSTCNIVNSPADQLLTGVVSKFCGNDGAVHITAVRALELTLNTNAGDPGQLEVDLILGDITKTGIPEPGSLALLGLGLAMGGLVQRKKVKANA